VCGKLAKRLCVFGLIEFIAHSLKAVYSDATEHTEVPLGLSHGWGFSIAAMVRFAVEQRKKAVPLFRFSRGVTHAWELSVL